jgi:4-hydroxy-4-methyl-2-oxoglutarate aldolase
MEVSMELKTNIMPLLLSSEMMEEFSQLSTTLISDAMAGAGVMDYKIKPIKPGVKLAGTAFTVDTKGGCALAVIAAVALARQGHILVISGKGEAGNAVIGDMLVKTALKSGISGIVVDGLLRDVCELRNMDMPLFAMGALPAAAEKKGHGELNSPILCGGISVKPGDLIVGDDDGVVVVPPHAINEVLLAAKAKLALEEQRIKDIENGLLIPEWLKKLL